MRIENFSVGIAHDFNIDPRDRLCYRPAQSSKFVILSDRRESKNLRIIGYFSNNSVLRSFDFGYASAQDDRCDGSLKQRDKPEFSRRLQKHPMRMHRVLVFGQSSMRVMLAPRAVSFSTMFW